MSDAIRAAWGYIGQGICNLRGAKRLVYPACILVALVSLLPAILMFGLTRDTEYLGVSRTYWVNRYWNSDSTTEANSDEFKSEGQILGEKLAKQRAKSRAIVVASVSGVIDVFNKVLIVNVLNVGLYSMYLKSGKGDVKFKMLFTGFTNGRYVNTILALIVSSVIASLPAFIMDLNLLLNMFIGVPLAILTLVLTLYLNFVIYILADDPSIHFLRVIKISWQASEGYKLTMLVITLIGSLPSLVCFTIAFFTEMSGIIDHKNMSMAFLGFFMQAILTPIMGLIMRPIIDSAIGCAYEDAKYSARNMGIISPYEFYNPEDQIDNFDDGGMKIYG